MHNPTRWFESNPWLDQDQMEILRAHEFWRIKHCLPSVNLVREIKGTPREAPPVSELTEAGSDEHEDLAKGKSSWMQFLSKIELDRWAGEQTYVAQREVELFLRYEWFEPYFMGHPDVLAIRADGAIRIQDFKTGPLPQIDYWTDQLHSYQTLADYEFHRLGVTGSTETTLQVISKYHGVINIPSTFAPEHRELILGVVNNKGKGDFFAGPWCRYCPARLVCRAFQESTAITLVDSGLEVVDRLPIGEVGADLLERLKLLQTLVKEKIDWYEEIVRKDPELLANKWKVGNGKRTGKIDDPISALDKLGNHIMDRQAFQRAVSTVSYAKARDWLVAHNGLNKKEAEEALVEILGDLLEFETSKGTVEKVIEQ